MANQELSATVHTYLLRVNQLQNLSNSNLAFTDSLHELIEANRVTGVNLTNTLHSQRVEAQVLASELGRVSQLLRTHCPHTTGHFAYNHWCCGTCGISRREDPNVPIPVELIAPVNQPEPVRDSAEARRELRIQQDRQWIENLNRLVIEGAVEPTPDQTGYRWAPGNQTARTLASAGPPAFVIPIPAIGVPVPEYLPEYRPSLYSATIQHLDPLPLPPASESSSEERELPPDWPGLIQTESDDEQ